jgi:hypothetical protein
LKNKWKGGTTWTSKIHIHQKTSVKHTGFQTIFLFIPDFPEPFLVDEKMIRIMQMMMVAMMMVI